MTKTIKALVAAAVAVGGASGAQPMGRADLAETSCLADTGGVIASIGPMGDTQLFVVQNFRCDGGARPGIQAG